MIGSAFKKLAQANGMKVSHGVAYGSLQGFAATLSEGAGFKQIVFTTKFPDPAQQDALLEAARQADVTKNYRVQAMNVAPDAIQIVFMDNPGTMKKIEAFLTWFLPLLRQSGATAYNVCTECGCDITAGRWLLVNGVAYYLHDACAEKSKRDIATTEQAEKEQRTGSYGMGILGAFLGAAVGAIVWALVLNLGYVAALVGLLIGWLADKGYTLLKGKQGKGKVIILIGAIIFGVVLGTLTADFFTIMGWINNGEIVGMTIADIPAFIIYLLSTEPEYLSATIYNLVLGLAFAGLGVFAMLRKAGAEVADAKIIDLE